jgi:hypothetical protein
MEAKSCLFFYLRASARIKIEASPGGQWTNCVEVSGVIVALKLPSFVLGVAWSDAFAVAVVFQVNKAPRLAAAFAFREFVCEDNAYALHWLAIAFAIPW